MCTATPNADDTSAAVLMHCYNEEVTIAMMHPFVTDKPALSEGSGNVFVDGSAIREINDLFPLTDVRQRLRTPYETLFPSGCPVRDSSP